jgi:hypothetical protein
MIFARKTIYLLVSVRSPSAMPIRIAAAFWKGKKQFSLSYIPESESSNSSLDNVIDGLREWPSSKFVTKSIHELVSVCDQHSRITADGRTEAFKGADVQNADDRKAIGLPRKKHVRIIKNPSQFTSRSIQPEFFRNERISATSASKSKVTEQTSATR